MESIGFTATRNITKQDKLAIGHELLRLHDLDVDRFVTGAAVGGDTFIGKSLVYLFPKVMHLVVVPSNLSQVDFWWTLPEIVERATVGVIWMSPGTSYKDRNTKIVDHSTRILGFPEFRESHPDSVRSGTWQTLRIAQRRYIPTEIYTLEDLRSEAEVDV